MSNLKSLISVILMLPFVCIAADELSNERHLEFAKEAYENNACKVAVYHFEQYLKAADAKKEKKQSIHEAIEWCKKYRDQEGFSSFFSGIDGKASKKPITP